VTDVYDLAGIMRNDGMETAAIEIDYLDHSATARRLARELGVTVQELGLDGLFGAEEHLTVGTHYGTHLDAPTHYADVVAGRPALPVDRMPLEPLFADGVLLDFSDRGVEPITAADLAAGYAAVGVEPVAGQMLMTHVGIEEHALTDPRIRERGAGMDESAIEWLFERDIRLTATDSLTQDMPIPWMEERFRAGDREAYFPVHRAGMREDYVHVEKANGLRTLPGPTGYRVAAFPVKVEGGSGAWTRFHALSDLPFDPAAVQVVDLSQPIRRHSMEPYESTVVTHGSARRQRQWAKKFGIRVEEMEARGSWDEVHASTRAGTHLEAPFRFGPECNGGDARTVDRIPLDWCFGRAAVLDVSAGERWAPIERAELVEALETAGHHLRAGDIVLLRTGAEAHFDGDPAFPQSGRGLSVAGLEYLVERGVRVIGTDAESLDRPVEAMAHDARRGIPGAIYPVHRAARRLEHCQVLKLARLAELSGSEAWISVAPVKVEGAGSGWCRAVGFAPRAQ
jgi:kynurenine formamidase